MIPRKLLEKKGCTSDRLRDIFTCEDDGKPEHKIRKRFQDRIGARILQGVVENATNSSLYQAVDMAWDSTPIMKETIPLLMWAQKKIDSRGLIKHFKDLKMGDQFVETIPARAAIAADPSRGIAAQPERLEEVKLNIPRIYEISVNLIRSYVTRRLAAQSTRFSNLWPYFKYEPRGTDLVSKLRGDALSERVDAMADDYNYRHFFTQSDRQHFMYARSTPFVRSAWDQKIGWRLKKTNTPSDEMEYEAYTEREGVQFVIPHPGRVFKDNGAPLADINTDTGPTYIGYWDIVPYRTIDTPDYYNPNHISVGDGLYQLLKAQGMYFGYYFDPKVLEWPEPKIDPSAGNDRTSNIGTYSAEDKDKGVIVSQYFERINPKKEGICKDLNVDVWIRLTIAGDNTVINGEFLTSRPAAYGGLNENDARMVNQSFAMEVMPFQDQLSNIYSQMLSKLKDSLFQIWAVDKDLIDADVAEAFKEALKKRQYYDNPIPLMYSGNQLRSNQLSTPGDKPGQILTVIQADMQQAMTDCLKAASEVLNLADRVLMFSPNEQAQPNPREVAAREITEISTSTNAISTFISDGIDEKRAACKRIIYESLVCESTEPFRVPVIERYAVDTIKKAGFELETPNPDWDDNSIVPLATPIVGNSDALIYQYYFDSRDGGDRPLNSQGAQVLGQMLGQIATLPPIMQAMGKKRLFDMINEICRMSGAAFDLKLSVADGESDALQPPEDPAVKQVQAEVQQMMQAMQQIMMKLGIAGPGGPPGMAQPSPAPQPGSPPPGPPPPPDQGPAGANPAQPGEPGSNSAMAADLPPGLMAAA